jgi:hypothetical protein
MAKFLTSLKRIQPNRPRNIHGNGEIKLDLRGGYPGFSFRFGYPHFVPFTSTINILDKDAYHPLRAKVQRRYDNIDQSIMWPSFLASVKNFEKGILRSVYRKRLRKAFKEALKAEGLDGNGRKLDDYGKVIPGELSPIRGSILFQIEPGFEGVSSSNMQASCVKVIKRVSTVWVDANR